MADTCELRVIREAGVNLYVSIILSGCKDVSRSHEIPFRDVPDNFSKKSYQFLILGEETGLRQNNLTVALLCPDSCY